MNRESDKEMEKSNKYWENVWKEENREDLYAYLDKYYKSNMPEIEIFKEHQITKVCDAACGFGAYSLAFASNGFEVYSFDISETAVEIARTGLKRYGVNEENIKVASILDTKYPNETFEGIVAHAIIDHLTVVDARNALKELLRITKNGGLIMISFDEAEEEDLSLEHTVIESGTLEYVDDTRMGMLFHPYDWGEIEALIQGYEVVYKATNVKKEKIVIIKKFS